MALKIYNDSNIEQLGALTVKLRHKVVICRFFLVVGYGPALLGITNIQVLSILKTVYKFSMVKKQAGSLTCR